MIVPYTQTSGHLGYSVRTSSFHKDREKATGFKNEKFTNILVVFPKIVTFCSN